MAKGFIYAILNKRSRAVYVGSTIQEVGKRWRCHRSNLRKGCHSNPHLQNAWNKYGELAFEFRVVEEGRMTLHIRERSWKNSYEESGFEIYNIATIGPAPMLGRSHSKETRIRMSSLRLKNPPFLGKKHSTETRLKMSKSHSGSGHTGINHSAKTRDLISKKNLGRKLSVVTRQRMSIAQKKRQKNLHEVFNG